MQNLSFDMFKEEQAVIVVTLHTQMNELCQLYRRQRPEALSEDDLERNDWMKVDCVLNWQIIESHVTKYQMNNVL